MARRVELPKDKSLLSYFHSRGFLLDVVRHLFGKNMSGRGIDFLENWIQQRVTEADRKGSKERAKELADKCITEAAALGITMDDLEPEWGSVEEIIFDAMQDVLGDELEHWKIFAAIRERREGNKTVH